MKDPSSPTRDRTHASCMAARDINPWAATEVPPRAFNGSVASLSGLTNTCSAPILLLKGATCSPSCTNTQHPLLCHPGFEIPSTRFLSLATRVLPWEVRVPCTRSRVRWACGGRIQMVGPKTEKCNRLFSSFLLNTACPPHPPHTAHPGIVGR